MRKHEPDYLLDPEKTHFPHVTNAMNGMSNRLRGKMMGTNKGALGILDQALEQIQTDETLSGKLDEYGIEAIDALAIGNDFLKLIGAWPDYFTPKVIWADAGSERILHKDLKENRSGFRKLVLRTYPEALLEYGLSDADIESLSQKETFFASIAISLDHNIPLSLGGRSETANFILMHPIVNAWKGEVVESQERINIATGGLYIIPYVMLAEPRIQWTVGRIDNREELARLDILTRNTKTGQGFRRGGGKPSGSRDAPPTFH